MAKTTKTTTRSRRAAAAVEQGPRYQVIERSYVDNVLREAGEEVTYFGAPGSKLRPINAEATARKKKIRDIRVDEKLDAEAKANALQALSDEWNGVEEVDEFADGESGLIDNPLPDAGRVELEKHAAQTVADTEEAQKEDTNFTRVKLQGKLDPTPAELQGATPVTDGKKSK